MRILKKDFWSKFVNEDRSFNGFLFEELVGVLLEEHFSGQWRPTPHSWDGGKDFEKDNDDGNGYSWAECKIYGKTISIRTISNTLVMAVNEENVKDILIFSYSRLNANAINHLGDFSSATEIKVNVFDDERLELLILRSKLAIAKYFSNVKVSPYQLDPFSISSFLSNTPHIERAMINEQEGALKPRKALFEINSPCLFEIFIHANKRLVLTFDFQEVTKNRELLGLLNYDRLEVDEKGTLLVDLTEGQIESLKLYFAPSKSGVFRFPELSVSNSYNSDIIEVGDVPYEVSRLHYPPFIGAQRLSLLENEFRAKISANNEAICVTVSGKSGVGKTRFLHECKRLLFRENYSVRHVDCHSTGFRKHDNFARTLLAQVWRLPYPIATDHENLSNKSEESENIYTTLFDILYSNTKEEDFSTREQLETLCALLLKGILKQRLAIIVDNVQFLEEASINLLQKLYSSLVNAPGQNALILSFNQEELLFSDAALSFHMAIRENAARRVKNEMYCELEEFTENHVEQFLNSVLESREPENHFTIHYPEITRLIKENILPRPLDLWQFLQAARDEEAVLLEDGYFFVLNESRFIELAKAIQKNTAAIYEYRLKKLSSDSQLMEILFMVANLGDVTPAVLHHFYYSEEKIQILIDTSILKYGTNEKIEFYHPSIEKFIVRKLGNYSLFKLAIRKKVAEEFLASSISESFPLAAFLMTLNPTDNDVIKVLKLLKSIAKGYPSERIRIVANRVREYLLGSSTISVTEYIDMVIPLCTMSAKEGNRAIWLEHMKEFKQFLHDFVPGTELHARHYFGITREICSAQTASYQAKDTIEELDKGILEMKAKLAHLPANVYAELHANFLNRQCVCYKNLSKIDEALKLGEKAREIAIECNALGLACLCMVDLGYIYFSDADGRTKMLARWDEAIEFYYEQKDIILEQIPIMEYVILLIEGCSYALKGNYRRALQNLDKLVNDCSVNGLFFYLLQGKLTKAIMLTRELLDTDTNGIVPYTFKDAIQIAQSVEDSAAISEMTQFYRYSLHLQAIIWEKLNEPDNAATCYIGLLRMLSNQQNKKRGILSFNDEMIVYDAWGFQSCQKTARDLTSLLKSFPDTKSFTFLKNNARPYSVFSIGKVNLPLH